MRKEKVKIDKRKKKNKNKNMNIIKKKYLDLYMMLKQFKIVQIR